MDRNAEFKRWKAQGLSKADLSRKGSVDEDVVELVQLLNGREQYFTTSSCAGRIILLDGVRPFFVLSVPTLVVCNTRVLCPPEQHPSPNTPVQPVFVLLMGSLGFFMKLAG